MRVSSLIFVLMFAVSRSAIAQEQIYLQCTVGVTSGEFGGTEGEERAFLIDKVKKTITQIITGLSESDQKRLSHVYSETDTQYVSDDGFISINKYSLEYDISSFGSHMHGKCVVIKAPI